MSEDHPQDPSSSAPHFPNGEYQIEGMLGAGGMAVVYRARDLRRPRTVAIKVLRSAIVQSIGTDRFLREIAVTAGFSHPHILPLLDSGETTDQFGQTHLYYVMPLVEGESLADRIEREHRLPLADALRLTREVLEALQYAHEHGVVHRDIKPANVLLSGGHAVVADFGVARPVRRRDTPVGHTDADSITETGIIIGTPTYMSPEQALGDAGVDQRTDVYAVGCVLYEMLTGVPPFEGHSGQSLVTRKISGVFLPATSVRSGVPPDIDAVLSVALRPEASDRYPTAAQFLNALSGIEHRSGSTSASFPRRTQLQVRPIFIVALVIATTVGVAALSLRNRAPASPSPAVADKTRLAILPLEPIIPDSVMALVANALTIDMIDELAQYPALTVISRNGVLGFRGSAARVDSVAKILNVGSIVVGDIRRIDDHVQVTVRLIDGVTGAQLASADASGTLRDVLSIRSSIIDSVTSFLRTQIGEELKSSDRLAANNAAAWEAFARVRQIINNESLRGAWMRLSPSARNAKYTELDSLLLQAIALDERWDAPAVFRGVVRLDQAAMEENLGAFSSTPSNEHADVARRLRREAVALADVVLNRRPNDVHALLLRGRARSALWRTSTVVAPDSLRAAAEADLRAVVARRQDMADAWNELSNLLNMTGDYTGSRDAAETALKADAFLQSTTTVISRLFFTSLASGHTADARRWCDHGRTQYPANPSFWMCDLSILGWTGRSARDVSDAWHALDESEARDTNSILASGWGTRRLLVAAVAARAGLGDSAQAIAQRVRAALPHGAPTGDVDYGEAHVHALLDHPEQALPLIKRYLQTNPAARGQVRHSPWFASLKRDPRFLAITAPQ